MENWVEDGEECYGIIEYHIIAGLISENRETKLFDKLVFNVDQKYQGNFVFANRIF